MKENRRPEPRIEDFDEIEEELTPEQRRHFDAMVRPELAMGNIIGVLAVLAVVLVLCLLL